MKKFKTLFLVCIVAILTVSILACVTDNKVTYTFINDGETKVEKVEKGKEFTLPVPVKEGFEFDGWYLNEGFTGDPAAAKMTANSNTTFYAKWAQVYTVTLETTGGTLPAYTLSLRQGINLYDYMQAYVPQKADHQFAAWKYNNSDLTIYTTMPAANITLTARYGIGYTVERWLELLEPAGGAEYEKMPNLTLYDDLGKTVTYAEQITGFDPVAHTGDQTSVELTSILENNVLKIYYNRKTYAVTYKLNYPNTTTSPDIRVDAKYGQQVSVLNDIEFEGYYLAGWTDGSREYKTNYIAANLHYNPQNISGEKFNVTSNATLNAVWAKGLIDVFGGKDYIFIDRTNPALAYLCRAGFYFQGTINSGDFSFRYQNESKADGRIIDGASFAYFNSSRGKKYTLYLNDGRGLDESVKITLDAYNGITYSVGTGVTADSKGTYSVNEKGYHTATFTTGNLSGSTMVFITGKADGTDVFIKRNEVEYGLGELFCFYVEDNGSFSYISDAYQVALSGFGTAAYYNGTALLGYYYTYNDITGILTLLNNVNEVVDTMYVFYALDTYGYMPYVSTLDDTFTISGGGSLKLDGLYSAEYFDGTNTFNGNYYVSDSALGDITVRFFAFETQYVFMLDINSSTGSAVTSKSNNYAEHYYHDESGRHNAPLLIIDGTSATIYSHNSTSGAYEISSSGTYLLNSQTGLYTYTATTHGASSMLEVKGTTVDLSQIISLVFALDYSTNSAGVHYWHSVTVDDGASGEEEIRLDASYTSEDGKTAIKLVGGFGFYTFNEGAGLYSGTYETDGSIITIYAAEGYICVKLTGGTTYVELEFIPYTSSERTHEGTTSSTNTLKFDGIGGGVYTDETQSYSGTITETSEVTISGLVVYEFVSTDETFTFKFIQLYTSTTSYFSKYNATQNGVYTSADGTLRLDKCGYMAYFTDASNKDREGRYFFVNADTILFNEDGNYLYFDLKANNSFTLRGSEFNEYYVMNNDAFTRLYVMLDGYHTATVFTTAGVIDAEAEYTANGDIYTVTYDDEGSEKFLIGKLTYITYESAKLYVFKISYEGVAGTYLNETDWSVLTIDDIGNALRRGKDGLEETGTYTLITNSILYYVNDAGTGATAGLYTYNKAAGTISPVSLRERGYYTSDLKALLLSKYGFVSINGERQYFYNVEGSNTYIYRRLIENDTEPDNGYGFAKVPFVVVEKKVTWNGVEYFENNGFAIVFNRLSGNNVYPYVAGTGEDVVKTHLSRVAFQPGSKIPYAVTGTVVIGSSSYECYVYRTETEFYMTVGNFRYDIQITYAGENSSGDSMSTFIITGSTYIETLPADIFLTEYFYYLNYEKTIITNKMGTIYLNYELDTLGEKTGVEYLTASFGSFLYDSFGNLVSIGVPAGKVKNFTKTGDMYRTEFEAEDNYTYCIYFTVGKNLHTKTDGYRLKAFARIETITQGDYEITIERVLASESRDILTRIFYSASLKIDGVDAVIESIQGIDDNSLIVTVDDGGTSKSYRFVFTDSIDDRYTGNLIPFDPDSASVTEEQAAAA